MKRTIILLLMLLAAASSVFAESDAGQKVDESKERNGFYLGLGMGKSQVDYSQPGMNLTFDGMILLLRAGYDFNEFIGTELRLGMTGDGGQAVGASTVKMGVAFASLLLKPQYPVNQDARVYGVIGISNANIYRQQVTPRGVITLDDNVTKNGMSFGFGGEYDLGDQWSLGLEWVQYWTDVGIFPATNATVWGAGTSINYYF